LRLAEIEQELRRLTAMKRSQSEQGKRYNFRPIHLPFSNLHCLTPPWLRCHPLRYKWLKLRLWADSPIILTEKVLPSDGLRKSIPRRTRGMRSFSISFPSRA
jgi:hypothetical protein